MSNSIVLKAGDLQATFLPESGMRCVNLMYKERALIEEGLLIGPHFGKHQTNCPTGSGRYASWQATSTGTTLEAHLSGEEMKTTESQNFKMHLKGVITPSDLELSFSIVSDSDSLIGIDYVFPYKEGIVETTVKNKVYKEGKEGRLPEHWDYNANGKLKVPVSEAFALSVRPYPDGTQGEVSIDNFLKVEYTCSNEESSWILRNQPKEKLLSIGAVTSQNPWKPNLTVSSMNIKFSILAAPK